MQGFFDVSAGSISVGLFSCRQNVVSEFNLGSKHVAKIYDDVSGYEWKYGVQQVQEVEACPHCYVHIRIEHCTFSALIIMKNAAAS